MSFTEGLMTGANLGRGMYRARGDRQVGSAMASGNFTGAAAAAYGQGDLQTGQALDTQARQQAERKRGLQQIDALRSGDFEEAMSFAQTPQEAAQITAWRNSASEAEVAEAARQAGRMAAVGQSLRGIPDVQERFRRAQALAPQFQLDPADITIESVSDGALDGFVMQSVGMANWLTHQDRLADNRRQDEQFAETRRHNQATEGVAQARVGVSQAREGRVAAGRGSGAGRSGGGATRPAAAPSRPPWERF